ncbi:hypothetical protein HMI54_002383 [Coelomomyces lativittatus]|nr:hypothetical protein HMI54_002383 [Coelomomyces lativittatus]KAJ1509996.1 hypothetical protein HMI55_007174 [Coelomomyces lativittatus]KAJ1513898.1 hypothetical protein HMI56_001544 [Coelomomyces lativittatus]
MFSPLIVSDATETSLSSTEPVAEYALPDGHVKQLIQCFEQISSSFSVAAYKDLSSSPSKLIDECNRSQRSESQNNMNSETRTIIFPKVVTEGFISEITWTRLCHLEDHFACVPNSERRSDSLLMPSKMVKKNEVTCDLPVENGVDSTQNGKSMRDQTEVMKETLTPDQVSSISSICPQREEQIHEPFPLVTMKNEQTPHPSSDLVSVSPLPKKTNLQQRHEQRAYNVDKKATQTTKGKKVVFSTATTTTTPNSGYYDATASFVYLPTDIASQCQGTYDFCRSVMKKFRKFKTYIRRLHKVTLN